MSNYRVGLMMPVVGCELASQKQGLATYQSGVTVGIVTGGYFNQELRKLNTEVEQMQAGIGALRGLDESGKLKPITSEQETWYRVAWSPFYQGWRSFYEKQTSTWRPYAPLVRDSLAEHLEDYRRGLIGLRKQADALHGNQMKLVPQPSEPKKYQSLLYDIGDMIKDGVKFLFITAIGIVVVLFLYKRFG